MSRKSELKLDHDTEGADEVLKPFTPSDNPKYSIGQISLILMENMQIKSSR